MTVAPHMVDAEAYRAYYVDLGTRPEYHRIRVAPTRMTHFHPQFGEHILDLGCGSGGNCIRYAMDGCQCLGVDLSPDLIRAGREGLKDQFAAVRPHVALIVGAIEDFSTERRFQHVLITEVLEHVVDPVAVLRVAREHLDEEGQVYITAPAVRVGSISHVRGVPMDDLRKWLDEAGLKSVWHIEQPNRTNGESYMQTVCKAVAA